jgi:hypothetical protein
MMNETISSLLQPEQLHEISVLHRSSSIPRLSGIYAWYFTEIPPGVPIQECHRVLDHTLLYIGIAPKETRGTTKPSRRTLHHRIYQDHIRGNAEGSTLRLTLGLLLSKRLGIQLRRVGSGRRFTFTNVGEQILDGWMASNAKVVWAVSDKPWKIEKALLASSLSLPLNLQGNNHLFGSHLLQIRRAAKDTANLLPIVEDNGGARRALAAPLPAGQSRSVTQNPIGGFPQIDVMRQRRLAAVPIQSAMLSGVKTAHEFVAAARHALHYLQPIHRRNAGTKR